VKLQPNHDYSLSVNCPAAMNFKSAGGESAETYPISFRTGDTVPRRGGAKKLLLETNRAAVQELQRAIDEDYSYRDLRNVDWDKIFKEHGPKLEGAESPAAFARAAAKLLEPAKDLHVWLQVGKLTIATHRRRVPPNCELSTLARVVPDWKKHNDCVATGRFDGGFGYILISTWAPKGPAELEPAFEALDELREAKGIVVDVRSNAGGDELLARDFAGCFVSKPTLYSRNDSGDRSGGEFLQPLDRVVEPKEGRPAYRGKVAVLIGLHNMSSCESFILMMRESGQARLFGERTYGSSGNPKPVDLGNGVTVFLSSWRDMLPDGTLLEGKGIEPDEAVKAGDKGFQKDDPVLEAALAWLRQ
jgi:hypothetical protein